MSYMFVHYEEVMRQPSGLPYRLLRFGHQVENDEDRCVPLLFIPGNQGSYKQVRTIGARLLELGHTEQCYAIYTLDLLEQWSVVSSKTIHQQSQFTIKALEFIEKRHEPGAILVGHSMGSVVARVVLKTISRKLPLISLAAPIDRPVLDIDSELDPTDYRLDSDDQMIFISGGHSDIQVLPHGTHSIGNLRFMSTETIPLVWSSPDHQAVVWVHSIVRHIVSLIQSIH